MNEEEKKEDARFWDSNEASFKDFTDVPLGDELRTLPYLELYSSYDTNIDGVRQPRRHCQRISSCALGIRSDCKRKRKASLKNKGDYDESGRL